MGMTMRLLPIPRDIVVMLMMFVVRVRMTMQHAFVGMFVPMALAQVQPDTKAHQKRRNPEWRRRGFAEQQDAQGGTDKRRSGKISPGA